MPSTNLASKSLHLYNPEKKKIKIPANAPNIIDSVKVCTIKVAKMAITVTTRGYVSNFPISSSSSTLIFLYFLGFQYMIMVKIKPNTYPILGMSIAFQISFKTILILVFSNESIMMDCNMLPYPYGNNIYGKHSPKSITVAISLLSISNSLNKLINGGIRIGINAI